MGIVEYNILHFIEYGNGIKRSRRREAGINGTRPVEDDVIGPCFVCSLRVALI
jgi:hypothetical protein